VKSHVVIPAKAGIQTVGGLGSRFRGNDEMQWVATVGYLS
jgi:hypothetical protein